MTRRFVPAIFLSICLAIPLLRGPSPEADFDYGDQPNEPILEGLNETSSGLASGSATPDGRPLLWKSRDRGGTAPVEFHYYDDGRIPFIAVTDENSTTTYYGGLNALGFGLENTDAHNIQHGQHNDGRVILDALAQCRTVDDLAGLLDSADQVDEFGRYGYTYGCIDAYGGAAIYEAFQRGHRRYDAIDSPDGILIRSNYAYQGDDPAGNPNTYGLHRHNRIMQLFRAAHARGELNAQYIMQTVARDLTIDKFSPYPLPFRGYYSNGNQSLPYGCIDNNTAVCRSTTTAVMVAQGVRDGERPDNAILWSMNGSPVAGIMTPLWVRAGSTPVEYDGRDSSRINGRIIQLYNIIYGTFPGAVDTWLLTNPQGTGLWDFLLPLERSVFAKTERFISSPQFSLDRLEGFQNEMAQQIADSLERWKPTHNITEVANPIFWRSNLILAWGVPNLEGREAGVVPRGYDIFRSPVPFREAETGIKLATVQEPEFTDTAPLADGGFYKIVAFY